VSHQLTIRRRTKARVSARPIENIVEDVWRHVEPGALEPAAEEAQHVLEGDEADRSRKAEEASKAGRKK
jgi:hypothetical protein